MFVILLVRILWVSFYNFVLWGCLIVRLWLDALPFDCVL